jgi:2-polyprenyl-3-methyl-5-hydroxy-6-metoxy-1,4-benzoquinol methylase
VSPGWNHNTHHHPLVLRAVRPGYRRAVDVGCGEGGLARELRAVLPDVTGVDADGPSIALARHHDPDGTVTWVHGDVHAVDLAPADLVACVAALHHGDTATGLRRLRALVRPGGTLVVIGLARSDPRSWPADLAGLVLHRVLRRRHGYHEHSAPVRPPTLTYPQVRRTAEELLPGVRYRRHPLWRYSLTWTAPG